MACAQKETGQVNKEADDHSVIREIAVSQKFGNYELKAWSSHVAAGDVLLEPVFHFRCFHLIEEHPQSLICASGCTLYILRCKSYFPCCLLGSD